MSIQCIPAHYISISRKSHMSTEQVTKPHRFLREPRGKLLICIECGKGKKECKCRKKMSNVHIAIQNLKKQVIFLHI